MSTFKLVRIDKEYRDARHNAPLEIERREGFHVVDIKLDGSIPASMVALMKGLKNGQIIILNRLFTARGYAPLPPDHPYLFRSLYRSGYGSSVLTNEEALRPGNFFLCYRETLHQDSEAEQLQELEVPFEVHEYRYHVGIDETHIHRTRTPAYVNLDRGSDNIGGSSWDGNLTRWFEAGFTTRIQYGIRAGLFPEE